MTTGSWRALRRFWESDPGLSVFLGLLVALPLRAAAARRAARGADGAWSLDLGFSALLLAGVAAVSSPSRRQGRALRAGRRGDSRALGPVLEPRPRRRRAWCRSRRWPWWCSPRPFARAPSTSTASRAPWPPTCCSASPGPWPTSSWRSWAPGPSPAPASAGPRGPSFVYFSFVTLTTVGYGDVTPVHPVPARWPSRKRSRDSSTRRSCSPASSRWRRAAGTPTRRRGAAGLERARTLSRRERRGHFARALHRAPDDVKVAQQFAEA